LSKRGWILIGSALPLLALFALLAWASAQSRGNPGGFGVNAEFGQVEVSSDQAADFSLQLMTGGTVTLAEVYLEYEGRPVEFVGVDIWDESTAAQKHIDRYGVTYPNGIDTNGIIAINYGVTGLPEKFFISLDGRVVKKFVGPMSPSKLRDILNEMLGERPPLSSR